MRVALLVGDWGSRVCVDGYSGLARAVRKAEHRKVPGFSDYYHRLVPESQACDRVTCDHAPCLHTPCMVIKAKDYCSWHRQTQSVLATACVIRCLATLQRFLRDKWCS